MIFSCWFVEHANIDSRFFLEEEEGVFRISSGNPTKAGERVYISMGNKPNSQLLLSYGFVLAQNQYDTVPISMFLNEEDPFRDVKAKILASKGILGAEIVAR